MSERATLLLGRVRRDEEGFEWLPGPASVFDARAGEPVDLILAYEYDEATRGKETFRVRFRAEVDGRVVGEVETEVKDRPGVHDAERGALTLATWFATPGLVNGKFEVEALYGQGPWGAAAKSTEALKESGRFLVRVH